MQAQFHAPSVQARASAGITMVLWHGLTETPLALDAPWIQHEWSFRWKYNY